MILFEYDTQKYDFRAWAQSVIGVEHLEKLHEEPYPTKWSIRERSNHYLGRLHQAFTDEFLFMVHQFIYQAVEVKFGPIVSYQTKPALRVHLSGCGSISGWHRDKEYGQNPNAQNVWVPFTKVGGNNSLWIESEEGKEDFAPLTLEYGQAVIFDGANLMHGSKENDTDFTRLSTDIRILGNH